MALSKRRRKTAELESVPIPTSVLSGPFTHGASVLPADLLLSLPLLFDDLGTLKNLLFVCKRFHKLLSPRLPQFLGIVAVEGVELDVDDFSEEFSPWGNSIQVGSYILTDNPQSNPLAHGVHKVYNFGMLEYARQQPGDVDKYRELYGEIREERLRQSQQLAQFMEQKSQDPKASPKRKSKRKSGIAAPFWFWKHRVVITEPNLVDKVKNFLEAVKKVLGTNVHVQTHNYLAGRKHGIVDKRRHPTSGSIETYAHDKKHGLSRVYEEGDLVTLQTWKEGKLDGPQMTSQRAWRDEERKYNYWFLKHDKKQGEEYVRQGGVILSRSHYDDGVLSGIHEEWDYLTGVRTVLCEYDNGVIIGDEFRWSRLGFLTLKKRWIKPKKKFGQRSEQKGLVLDGLYQEWYADGTKKLVELWNKGVEDGEHEHWSQYGIKTLSMFFDEGEKIGEIQNWDGETGIRTHHVVIEDGYKHGEERRWDNNNGLTGPSLLWHYGRAVKNPELEKARNEQPKRKKRKVRRVVAR